MLCPPKEMKTDTLEMVHTSQFLDITSIFDQQNALRVKIQPLKFYPDMFQHHYAILRGCTRQVTFKKSWKSIYFP